MTEKKEKVTPVTKELDTTETMEMIKAVKVLTTFAAAVMADHRLDASDLSHLVALSSKYQIMADAWTGKEKILPELKNLKKDELVEVLTALYEAFEVFATAKTIAAYR